MMTRLSLSRRGVHWARMVYVGGMFAPIEWDVTHVTPY